MPQKKSSNSIKLNKVNPLFGTNSNNNNNFVNTQCVKNPLYGMYTDVNENKYGPVKTKVKQVNGTVSAMVKTKLNSIRKNR